jgi:hypothetical protein
MLRITGAVLAMVAVVGSASAQAKTYFNHTEFDYGVSAVGPVLVHYYPITNSSKNTVTMGTPRIQCGCVSVTLLKGSLAPGETTFLIASMHTAKIPTQQIGQTKSVTVHVPFLSPVLEEVATKVTVVARPDMIWSTTDGLGFGTVAKGKTAKASMKITLYGNNKWEISKTESSGKFVEAEAKLLTQSNSETTYEINATLKDDCPEGPWMTEVFVKTNAVGIEKMRIPVMVNVVAAITTNPGTLKLGSVPMGAEQTRDVLLTGLQPFKVLGVNGVDEQVKATAQTEGAKNQHTIKVSIKAGAEGDLVRELKILTDNKDMPTVLLPVSATAKK